MIARLREVEHSRARAAAALALAAEHGARRLALRAARLSEQKDGVAGIDDGFGLASQKIVDASLRAVVQQTRRAASDAKAVADHRLQEAQQAERKRDLLNDAKQILLREIDERQTRISHQQPGKKPFGTLRE